MNERTSRKIPVTERQFLWVQDDDKGEVTLHVGPTMVSPTAADRVVVDDGQGGLREDPTGRPQLMIEVGDTQYAVLHNPILENDGGPNGRFRPGRNESRTLKNGTRAMIPGPCSFWLRPGQRVEVRDAHELASDQYLLVKVYGELDTTAPYADVTVRSAGITRATSVSVGGDRSEAKPTDVAPTTLERGRLIVIRGIDTQLYIPPTGVDIVPDTSMDQTGLGLTADAALELLSQERDDSPAPEPSYDREELAAYVSQSMTPAAPAPQGKVLRRQLAEAASPVDQSVRSRHRKGAQESQEPSPPPLAALLSNPTVRRALERQARQARLVRRAVVLGEKEYSVIIDADGKREIKVGPARVFPGPYDQFMVTGSRDRIYDAYELLPQRGLWLRVIAPISREALSSRLPRGAALDKDFYYPGDELLLTGVSTFFFPFNEIEVLSPETGEAVIGNDHFRVFIEAIGIDQKSGIYVRDLATGEARLVLGKQSYLVDPRKEVQITRNVAPVDWNLWISAQEPHKYTQSNINTPWALSITVPHGTAVLATSAMGQRVVEGPCVTLLGYEERLTPLSLSTGTPKSDDNPLRTCYLRTFGNRVSDLISLETRDFVALSVHVSYSVTFLPEHRDRWFNSENYVQVICEHLRSLARGRCRTVSLADLWPQLPALLRDTILGEKTTEGRKGRLFSENGCVVTEVEVLAASIEDEEIGELMREVQTESVRLVIGDRQAQAKLESIKLRTALERQQLELESQHRALTYTLEGEKRRIEHELELARLRATAGRAAEEAALAASWEWAVLEARLAREAKAREVSLQAQEEESKAQALIRDRAQLLELEYRERAQSLDLDHKEKLHTLELALLQAHSASTVAERQAVQPALVEALSGLGDKLLLSEAAANMNLVSLFKGKDVATLLGDILGGTKVMPTVNALLARYGGARSED